MTKKYGEDIVNVSQVKEIQDKIKATWKEKYGVDNPNKSKEIQDKIKATNVERYGAENPFASKEIKEKIKKIWQEKYGKDITNPFQVESIKEKVKATWQEKYGEDIVNISQVKEIQDKIKATNVERYGVKNAMQNEKIKEKAKQTNLKKYGFECPLQSEEVKKKTKDTWSFNGHEGPCSRQQKYLANLVNGKINTIISGYWADIVLENEKIDLEYDGGGHNLCVMRKQCTQEEFDVKEKIREESICKKGYKIIRIISKQDNLPSDEIILNLVEGFKNSDFQVVRIDIDEGTIDRDYSEKWYCNFGELRKITKKNLEKIESEKTINLK